MFINQFYPRLVLVISFGVLVKSVKFSDFEPLVEFRGVFMATVTNIDWPRSSRQGTSVQRAELIDYVNTLASVNMNAVMFQARTTGDAFYQSTIEPWSKYLTGKQGLAPDPLWDPLETLIKEAYTQGIEVHAWLNPYRANMAPNWDGLAPNHVANVLRQYAYPYGKYLWMDPGADAVVEHLLNVTRDIVTRYEINGIHMDDYFYPYPHGSKPFPDDTTYSKYLQKGGSLSKDNWRRQNVNNMIVRISKMIKTIRPGCIFSISPFGLYRPGQPGGMPPPLTGFDPYSQIYADSKLWLEQGWVDFLAPQLYWAINSTGQSYPMILDWWLQNNPARKNIYAATGVHKVANSNNWPMEEIVQQVSLSRDTKRYVQMSMGNIHFSAKYFRDNLKGIRDTFKSRVYTRKAYPILL